MQRLCSFLLVCLHTLYAYTLLSPNFQITKFQIKNMYKSMLQELCQKKSWKLPIYESVKDGLDHKPQFRATVTVNDSTFESPEKCGSSKEAQNVAARVAFNHFSPLPTDPPQQQIPVNSRRQELSSSGNFFLSISTYVYFLIQFLMLLIVLICVDILGMCIIDYMSNFYKSPCRRLF